MRPPSVVLDAHALTEWARTSPPWRLLAALEVVQRAGGVAVVPTAVLVEALTGQPQDAAVNHRVRRARTEPLDEPLARSAAALRKSHPAASVTDAAVAATAARWGSLAVLTSDPNDLTALLANTPIAVEHV